MPDYDEAGNERLEENVGKYPAGMAAPVGVTENLEGGDEDTRHSAARREGPEEAWRHHGRANGPEAVAEEPWHLTSHSCRPKYAEVVNPQNCSTPQRPK